MIFDGDVQSAIRQVRKNMVMNAAVTGERGALAAEFAARSCRCPERGPPGGRFPFS